MTVEPHPRRRALLAMVVVGLMVVCGCTTHASWEGFTSPGQTARPEPRATKPATKVVAAKPTADKPRRTPTPAPRALARIPAAAPPPDTVSPPVRITIPALSIDQDLVGLRVNRADGTLTPPSRWGDIGWWSAGPAPGAPGAAVIAGHVDSETGPAVFAGLGTLKGGAKVVIDRADGSVATFAVYKSRFFPRDHFPSGLVYRLSGPSELHLITCTGPYDHSAHHYTENYVVFAKPVHDTSRAS